jgi:hypothetical protein
VSTARDNHESLSFMTDVPIGSLPKQKIRIRHPKKVKGGNVTILLRHTARISVGIVSQEHFESEGRE